MADLALACEIEKSHFYYYFKDKKSLMKEVLLLAHTLIRTKVLTIGYQEELPAGQRLNGMMDMVLLFYSKVHYGCFLANSIHDILAEDESFRPLIQVFFEDWVKVLSKLYEEKYSPKEACKLAVQDYQLIQGSMLFMRLYDDLKYLSEATHTIKQRLA